MKSIIISSALLVFFAVQLYPQRILTLDEAIQIARQKNPEYLIAKLDKLKAEKKVSEVYSENLVPTLTLNSRYTRMFKKNVINIFGQAIELGTDNSFTTTVDITEPIPILGTPVMSGIRIANYYSELQDENVNHAESKVKADVSKAFYNVMLIRAVVELNKQSLSNFEENLRVVEARNRAGVALEYDVIRAMVKVESIKPQLSQAQNNLVISKKNLKNVIGLIDDQDIDVTGQLVYDSIEIWGTMEDIIRNVSEKNVAIRQLNLTKKINEELNSVDYSNYLPKIYLFGQYAISTNENDDNSIARYKFYNSLFAGVGLSWDLNVFRTGYKEDQSYIDIKKTEEQIRFVRERLKTQSESAILRLEDARERIKAQKELIMQAERGLELATVSYKNGVLNQIDVMDAELAFNQVKLSYVTAIYEYLIARTDLEQLLEK